MFPTLIHLGHWRPLRCDQSAPAADLARTAVGSGLLRDLLVVTDALSPDARA